MKRLLYILTGLILVLAIGLILIPGTILQAVWELFHAARDASGSSKRSWENDFTLAYLGELKLKSGHLFLQCFVLGVQNGLLLFKERNLLLERRLLLGEEGEMGLPVSVKPAGDQGEHVSNPSTQPEEAKS